MKLLWTLLIISCGVIPEESHTPPKQIVDAELGRYPDEFANLAREYNWSLDLYPLTKIKLIDKEIKGDPNYVGVCVKYTNGVRFIKIEKVLGKHLRYKENCFDVS